jgi:hypothetical protein
VMMHTSMQHVSGVAVESTAELDHMKFSPKWRHLDLENSDAIKHSFLRHLGALHEIRRGLRTYGNKALPPDAWQARGPIPNERACSQLYSVLMLGNTRTRLSPRGEQGFSRYRVRAVCAQKVIGNTAFSSRILAAGEATNSLGATQ